MCLAISHGRLCNSRFSNGTVNHYVSFASPPLASRGSCGRDRDMDLPLWLGTGATDPAPAPVITSTPTPVSSEAKQQVPKVEVTTQRANATDERRESTAAKIVFNREDIEKYGDTNLADVLRRLPGVTQNSSGVISMRGMGAGFTQILIDGERVAPGFSIEQISPDQVERIEILRAPTAETGARAIAGTINIILRKPQRNKQDDLRASVKSTRGRLGEDVSLSRNDSFSPTGTSNMTLVVRQSDERSDNLSRSSNVNTQTGKVDLLQLDAALTENVRKAVTLSGQLQWKLGEGEQFVIQPFVTKSRGSSTSVETLTQLAGTDPAPFATNAVKFVLRFGSERFTTKLTKKIDEDTRIEISGGAGHVTRRLEFGEDHADTNGIHLLTQATITESRDISWNTTAKLTRNVIDAHKVVGGVEMEDVQRIDNSVTLLNGVRQLADFGSGLDISIKRAAIYLQDEWDPSTNWSANAGLRWEHIDTRSNVGGSVDNGAVRNSSSVLTPLGHAVWRFNAPRKDQLRLSLTQSYRSPVPFQLIARPRLDAQYPVPGRNTPVNPDYAGNPNLRPERANGIDLALERYLNAGGVISVNVFSRHIKDLIRGVTALETVSWATSPRYVYRPQNLGKATTNGIEFDAKFRLSELVDNAIPLEIRFNVSLFDSKVDSVTGPNNRINEQPRGTGNVGADYRFSGAVFTIGGNIALTPAYTIQNTNTQLTGNSTRRVIDAYALWSISPATKLRLTLSNLAPRDYADTTAFLQGNQLQTVINSGQSSLSVGLKLEMRL